MAIKTLTEYPLSLTFSIRAIPTSVAERIRETLIDDSDNRLRVLKSDAPAPCRHCLREAPAGSSLIVFAFQPEGTKGPYAEIGPIFIHADQCERYAAVDAFPEDYRMRSLTMRGYNQAGTIETAELSVPGEPEVTIEALFANDHVRCIHVRNPAWGCYLFQVDRKAAVR